MTTQHFSCIENMSYLINEAPLNTTWWVVLDHFHPMCSKITSLWNGCSRIYLKTNFPFKMFWKKEKNLYFLDILYNVFPVVKHFIFNTSFFFHSLLFGQYILHLKRSKNEHAAGSKWHRFKKQTTSVIVIRRAASRSRSFSDWEKRSRGVSVRMKWIKNAGEHRHTLSSKHGALTLSSGTRHIMCTLEIRRTPPPRYEPSSVWRCFARKNISINRNLFTRALEYICDFSFIFLWIVNYLRVHWNILVIFLLYFYES